VIGVALALGLAALAAPIAWLLRAAWLERGPDRIPILAYHRLLSRAGAREARVRDDEPMWVCYDDTFAAQMAELARAGFTPIDLDDYVAIRSGALPRPERPIAITFDDGYASNHALAFPVLRAHGFTATIFVALEPDAHTRRQVEGIDGFLDEAQLRELAAGGISIQSHSVTHRPLSELDDAEIRFELTESRRRLEAITGRPVRHFCVPRAGGDERVRRLVREAGYLTSCGSGRGTSTRRSDPFALPRLGVERDLDLAGFRRMLRPAGSTLLRAAGELKVVPARLLGPRRARSLRDRLYTVRRAPWFSADRIARVLVASAALGAGVLAGLLWAAL
jgi:peptidoglycan/xylan/chitin deacetylase (PgdA/CDA1 family)